jgi:hypothetical protein
MKTLPEVVPFGVRLVVAVAGLSVDVPGERECPIYQ